MICASRNVVLLDHMRVPYAVEPYPDLPAGAAAIWAPGREDAALLWPTDTDVRTTFGNLPVRGSSAWPGDVRCDERGRRLLPFDLDAALLDAWSEAYSEHRARRSLVLRVYYLARPLLPRRLQIALRRAFVRVQERASFPRWPLEPALHELCERVLSYVASAAGEPVPHLCPWPNGADWALVLTHDVEHAAGCERIPAVAELERAFGMRSSWNFVPRRYDTPRALLHELRTAGFEIGVHGLYHDGRDLAEDMFEQRLPAMQAAGRDWGAVGFRSPATHRSWRLMPKLGFDYDSSYPDTDPYEPQAGGCCSLVPFFNRELVELPITLPQDHTLFTILRHTDATTWIEKTEAIRERGGMALLITHPDYMDELVLGAYREYLTHVAGAPDVWHALPREVSEWWRRRASSIPVRSSGGWVVEGAAAGEARIAFASPADEPPLALAS